MRKDQKRGVTILELVVSLFLVSLLLLMVGSLVSGFFRVMRQNESQRLLYSMTEVADRIAYELEEAVTARVLRGGQGLEIEKIDPTIDRELLRNPFETSFHMTVRYVFRRGELRRIPVGNTPEVLLSELEGCQFSDLGNGNWEIVLSAKSANQILKTITRETRIRMPQ